MSRLSKIESDIIRLKAEKEEKKIKKKWKMPFKVNSLSKQSRKNDDTVLVLYLSQKYQATFKLCKIVSGNIIVINNKVHELNPRAMFRFGKHNFYVVREIDRKLISNEDYIQVKKRGDDTDEDVPLIKAVLGAQIKKSPLEGKKNWVVIIIVIIIALVAGFILFSG